MEKKVINSDKAPAAIGPYSQAIKIDNLLFLSGQIPLDPATGNLMEGTAAVQAERVMQNLEAVLLAGGSRFDRVIKTTIFLTDLADFASVNEVYAKHFVSPFPARSTVQVAGLPRGAKVEIELVALA